MTSGRGRVRGVTSESFGLPAPQWQSRRTGSQCSDPTPRDKGALSLFLVSLKRKLTLKQKPGVLRLNNTDCMIQHLTV